MKTIKDIVAEMRCGIIPRHRHDRELLMNFADRIEVAHKQSVTDCNQPVTNCHGLNAAKMREALKRIIKQVYEVDKCTNADVPYLRAFTNHIQQTAILALSAPPRNCDVYTTSKEIERQFIKETGSKSIRAKLIRWMLAEAKGDAK